MNIVEYLNLIPSQNREKPKFISWLSASLLMFDDAKEVLEAFTSEFDLDSAKGKQLDILGEVVGVNRYLNFQPQESSRTVDDTTYKRMLKAKIASNQWDGTIPGMSKIWDEFFPDVKLIVVDNQDMTVNVVAFGISAGIETELIQNGYYVPKAQSVSYNYFFSELTIFSYDISNDFYNGYDIGNWI